MSETEFRDWLKRQRDTTVPSDKFDPAYERGRADGLQVAIDEASRRAGSVPLDAEPAPLDTGRWEYDGAHSWTINGPGSRGVTLHPNGEIWNNIDGPPELTADDFEAAARIIRHHQEGTQHG